MYLQSDGATITVEAELSNAIVEDVDEESRDSPIQKAERTFIFKDENFVVSMDY